MLPQVAQSKHAPILLPYRLEEQDIKTQMRIMVDSLYPEDVADLLLWALTGKGLNRKVFNTKEQRFLRQLKAARKVASIVVATGEGV